ncbi:MAG: hypothetical protein WDO15_28700 [Bacteroidota bacterium]
MKNLLYFFILLSVASCSTFSGERSLGKNLTIIEGDKEEDRRIVYCPDKNKACSEGLKVIPANNSEYVDDVRSNDEWIIARTIGRHYKKGKLLDH